MEEVRVQDPAEVAAEAARAAAYARFDARSSAVAMVLIFGNTCTLTLDRHPMPVLQVGKGGTSVSIAWEPV